ncbi:phosphate ABC transporter permease subunit PstC [Trebonia kvetii]|uniref:Phosphate transport system permease protein n=1 Tax=Trebonia kvetii TaxID=2480626 RepID=A0A6P2C736_9ACTN|nr:phosphate ABC transporter permease subunit PstC [Trebonia kvetii]TVZ07252.1 phosphate ABC transporter permease subunit PstC [Trebonia kvetii]
MPAERPVNAPHATDQDTPRTIVARPSTGDKIFRAILRASGWSVFVITGMILLLLILRASKAFSFRRFGFLTTQNWIIYDPQHFGIAAILPLGILIAVIAMIIAVPTGIAVALYISEYSPHALRKPLIAVIDLMAAIPSIIFGVWGLLFLEPRILGFDSWLGRHLGWIPVFSFRLSTSTASNYATSTFIAGVVVSLMVIPIVTSLSRQVFSQAPQGEREGAYALGATRWGMIRTVVLPFGRGGVIGACMLGLGRALGETIAVTLILSATFRFNFHVLETGGNSIASTIANEYASFPNAGSMGLSALMAAGLVLFGMTLIVNTLGAIVIGRSRSGLATG